MRGPLPQRLHHRSSGLILLAKDKELTAKESVVAGNALGTLMLGVTPEAAIGEPLAHEHDGDRIALSVERREMTLRFSDAELARRASPQLLVEPRAEGGYGKLLLQCVTQADQEVDFDLLRAPAVTGKVPVRRTGRRRYATVALVQVAGCLGTDYLVSVRVAPAYRPMRVLLRGTPATSLQVQPIAIRVPSTVRFRTRWEGTPVAGWLLGVFRLGRARAE